VLHLATTTFEADVEMALTLLLDAVYELVREFRPALVPQVRAQAYFSVSSLNVAIPRGRSC
jgi:hypothetical protein